MNEDIGFAIGFWVSLAVVIGLSITALILFSTLTIAMSIGLGFVGGIALWMFLLVMFILSGLD